MNSAGGDDDDGLNTESETPLTWFDAELGSEETLDCWIPPSIRGFLLMPGTKPLLNHGYSWEN